MNENIIETAQLQIRPLSLELWPDLENLFGPKGAYGGCWCMWWRLSRKDFEKGQGESNRLALKELVASKKVAGLIAYLNDKPCGWCSVAPRDHFRSLERSRVLKRIDDNPVWSIVCFFIDKQYRGYGLSKKLIQGVIEYVKLKGGTIIEAYPTILHREKLAPVSSFMGLQKVFEEVGFKEMKRPSQSKIIMRYFI